MKVVICGAGIAGLALAQRLDTLGWQVVVLEKAPGPRPQGYMIDFFGPGYDAAEAMGVLPRLRELGYRFEEASWLDDAGRRRARLRFDQFGKIVHGRLFSILRPDLEQALREQLSDDIDLRFATSLDAVRHTRGVRKQLLHQQRRQLRAPAGGRSLAAEWRNRQVHRRHLQLQPAPPGDLLGPRRRLRLALTAGGRHRRNDPDGVQNLDRRGEVNPTCQAGEGTDPAHQSIARTVLATSSSWLYGAAVLDCPE